LKYSAEKVSAVLLCPPIGGELGFPVEMLRVDGAPLAVRVAERLREMFESVSIVTAQPEFLQHFFDTPLCRDEFPDAYPLGALHRALKLSPNARCFALACDMPLVGADLTARIVERGLSSQADVVAPVVNGKAQPLCALYSPNILPALEQRLGDVSTGPAGDFLEGMVTEKVEMASEELKYFRRLNKPGDVALLREIYGNVEPLPVYTVGLAAGRQPTDVVAEEWLAAIYINGLKLATVMCLPVALRELGVGMAAYMGLVNNSDDILSLEVNHETGRVDMRISATEDEVRRAGTLNVTSGCGGGMYKGKLPPHSTDAGAFRVSRTHILTVLRGLRKMAPVFSRTGATHQALFSDGKKIQFFFEELGRHNAVDKIVGAALMSRMDLRGGVIVSTGRLSSEMLVKAARQGVPVLASPSAVTTGAIQLAQEYDITLVGFARGKRLNVYTSPERILGE